MRRTLAVCALVLTLFEASVGQLPAADPGLFVAVGYGGRRLVSSDGFTWEEIQHPGNETGGSDETLCDIAYGADRFVAVGGDAATGLIMSSRDGRRWRGLPGTVGRVATVAFGNGRFVAAQDAHLLASTDGENFQAGPELDWKGSVHPRRSACGDTEAGFRFVIIGDIDLAAEPKRISWRGVTGDGTRWDQAALDTPAAHDIAYGAGHFVVVGPDGLIESSHDGQTWQRQSVAPGENLSRIVWTGARFLVSGGKTAWSSPDGLTWKSEPAAIPCDLAWAREGFLGIGFAWVSGLWASADFVHWKRAAIPSGPPLQAVAFGVGIKP